MMKIQATDRKIAGFILMRLARHPEERFCLNYFYEYDSDFLIGIQGDLGIDKISGDSLIRRLRKVCRQLEAYGILAGRLSSCHKEYIGEPTMLKSYSFCEPGYACRLAPDLHPHYKPMGKAETELNIFLDRAFGPENFHEKPNADRKTQAWQARKA